MTDSVSTNSLYRALRSAEADPDLAHAAVEAVTNLAGQNVIDVLGARIDGLESKMNVKFDAIESKFDVKFDALESKIDVKFDALESKIDVKFDALRHDMDRTVRQTNRLNAVLVGLLGVGVIGVRCPQLRYHFLC